MSIQILKLQPLAQKIYSGSIRLVATGIICISFSSNASAVNLKAMKQSMKADLDGTVNAYSFVIRQGDKIKQASSGPAKRWMDGDVEMATDTRSFIASVTKTVTAIAILQLLEDLALPVTAKISPWLPDNWIKGPGINQLSFKDLMQHETGFNQIFKSLEPSEKDNWGNDWDGLKWIVQNGAIPGSASDYKNANFALLRVLLPKLWKATGDPAADFTAITSINNGLLYIFYIDQYIFEPAGLATGASCTASEAYKPQALGYDVTDPDETGKMSESTWANCGGHTGLRLSADDLSRIMHLLVNDKLFSPTTRFIMDHFRLGWQQSSNNGTAKNKGKWWHGGTWNISGNRGYRACVMKYADGAHASLVINSRTPQKSACKILKDAYDNAQ